MYFVGYDGPRPTQKEIALNASTISTGFSRRGVTLGGAAALATVLAGCGGSSTQEAPENVAFTPGAFEGEATIRVLGWQERQFMDDVLQAFAAAYPSISVEYETVPIDQLSGVISSRIQAGEGAMDVYMADQPLVASFQSRGYTANLENAFGEYREMFAKATIDSTTIQDELHAIPISESTWFLYYNTDLLDAAGLEHPSADPAERMTWESLTEAARNAQEAGARYGVFFDYADKLVQMLQFTRSAGGGGGISGEEMLTADVNNEGWNDALKWYSGLFEEGLGPRGVPWAQGSELFSSGQIAYYTSGPWQVAKSLQAGLENFGIAPMPMFEGGEAVSGNGAWSLALNPQSANQEAALTFMYWMAIEDGGHFTQEYPNLNVPATSELLAAFPELPDFEDSPVTDSLKLLIPHELNETAATRPISKAYVEYENLSEKAFSDIRNGSDVAERLDDLQQELSEAFSRYK